MSISIVYAAMNPAWKKAKIGQSDGSLAGTSPVFTEVNEDYTDPRVNAFRDGSGTPLVDLCNRTGDWGTAGTGTHFVLGLPLTGPDLPSETAGLSSIVNPYAISQPYNGYIYVADYDLGRIMAFGANDATYTVASQAAFTLTNPGGTSMAIDLEVVGTALEGTYARDGVMTLDIKSVTATPTVSNEAYVYIMASSMLTATDYFMSRWITCQTTASTLIEAAIGNSPVNLDPDIPANNMTEVIGSSSPAGDYGAFWTAVYVQDGTGISGKLIIGRGVGYGGDQLEVYDVGASGFLANPATIAASTYYGARGIINTLTVVPPAASGARVRILRPVTPPPAMATAMRHSGEFLPNILKKLREESA